MKSSIVTEYKHMFFVTVLILILFSLVTGTPFVNGEDLEVPCEITTYGDAWEGSLGFGLFHFDTENIWQQYRAYMVIMRTDGSPILPSGSTLITVGGPLINPITAYYESDQTPSYNWTTIKCVTQDNWIEYKTRDGQEVAGMALEDVNDNSDLFLIQVFRDGRGRNIGICYGFGWKDTLTASKYIVREYEALTSEEASWMVGQWIDSNNNGFVNGPGDGDLYIVLDSN